MAEALALDGVSSGYGASVVVEDATLRVDEGESVALLGRNGVGKTTLLTTVMGLTRLHRGTITILPAIGNRPVPNLEHIILHLGTLVTAVVTAGFFFHLW